MSGEANQVLWRGVQPVSGIRGIWPAIDSERVNEHGTKNGAGDVVIYEVPANKILFVSEIQHGVSLMTDQETYSMSEARSVAAGTEFLFSMQRFAKAGQLYCTSSYRPAKELTAGWEIIVTTGHDDLYTYFSFSGWLEDV